MMPGLDTTVIIPVANGERYIAECLTSVCSQFSHTDEIIVVVDRSTDGTLAVLNRFLPRVKILHSSGKGPSAARNLGLTQARGRLIALLDHDDLWPPSRHKALRTALENDGSVNTAAGRIRIAVEDHADAQSYVGLHGRHEPALLWSCLFRRQLIERAGLFDETMRFGEDNDYYHRLMEAGMRVVHCDVDSLVYRRHATNATNAAPPRDALLMDLVVKKLNRKRNREKNE